MKGFPSFLSPIIWYWGFFLPLRNISILISAFRIQFFHCKNAHHFSLFFPRSLFFADFPLRLRNNLTRISKKGNWSWGFSRLSFQRFWGKRYYPLPPTNRIRWRSWSTRQFKFFLFITCSKKFLFVIVVGGVSTWLQMTQSRNIIDLPDNLEVQ